MILILFDNVLDCGDDIWNNNYFESVLYENVLQPTVVCSPIEWELHRDGVGRVEFEKSCYEFTIIICILFIYNNVHTWRLEGQRINSVLFGIIYWLELRVTVISEDWRFHSTYQVLN